MNLPPIISELLQLLFDLAAPAAVCTMVLAGTALRHEGGVNFQIGGSFQKWILWSVILLTLPQLLAWFGGQGVWLPPRSAGMSSGWVSAMEAAFKAFVTGMLVARLIPITAAFFVLKASLDTAQGNSPLGSIIAAMFMLSVQGTTELLQSWNSGSPFATTDMLVSAWNFVAGRILPQAAGLALVGAIVNYVRHKPVASLIASAMAFLSLSALWKLIQTMVGS